MSKSGSSCHVGGASRPNDGATRQPRRGIAATAAVIRARRRSMSGGWSTIVMLPKVELRNGSFSRFHMRASTSDMRRSDGWGGSATSATYPRSPPGYARSVSGGRGSAAGESALAGRVLELVELGPAVEKVDHALDGVRGLRAVALRPVHQPHEHGPVARKERRHAPHVVVGD